MSFQLTRSFRGYVNDFHNELAADPNQRATHMYLSLYGVQTRETSEPPEFIHHSGLESLSITTIGDPAALIDILILPNLRKLMIKFILPTYSTSATPVVDPEPTFWLCNHLKPMIARSDSKLHTLELDGKTFSAADITQFVTEVLSLRNLDIFSRIDIVPSRVKGMLAQRSYADYFAEQATQQGTG